MKTDIRQTVGKPEALKQGAMDLCANRCAYAFDEAKERGILAGLGARQLPQLVKAVLEILDNSDDGNLRVGAAELLGSITPTGMKDQVIATLEEYADDTFVRDYAYAGAQGDEDDMRSVGECAKASISELRSRNRR